MKRLLLTFITLLALIIAGCGGSDNKAADIAKTTGTNEQQAGVIINTLKDCGFTDYDIKANSKLDNATGAGEKAFLIKLDDPTPINLLIAPNGSIYKIYIPNHDIYANGAVQNKITGFMFTNDEKEKLMGIVKTIVNNDLKQAGMKDEKQAKYYGVNDWLFDKAPDISKVSSYVIVTNDAGAKRRWDFKATFNTKNGEVINFEYSEKLADKIPEQKESLLHSILN